MIYGIGIDIIEVDRIRKALNSDNFWRRVFTENEINYCQQHKHNAQNYAVRFAAKEAFFKALGTGLTGDFQWRDVEIQKKQNGAVQIEVYKKVKDYLKDKKIENIHLSCSHIKDYAVAYVILEK